MSALEIHDASRKLRELAESVEACQSWSFSPGTKAMVGDPASDTLLEFIHTMSPTLAIGLAATLDAIALRVDSLNDASPRELSSEALEMNVPSYIESLELARLINGGTA